MWTTYGWGEAINRNISLSHSLSQFALAARSRSKRMEYKRKCCCWCCCLYRRRDCNEQLLLILLVQSPLCLHAIVFFVLISLAQRIYAFICSSERIRFAFSKHSLKKTTLTTGENTKERKKRRHRSKLWMCKETNQIDRERKKRERQRNTVIQMCTRERETPDFYRKRAHTHTHTGIVWQSDAINLQSVDDLHGNVIRIQSTDISDVTTFSIVINDVFDASIIVVIIMKDVEAFFVICGQPLIAVHVRQEVQIEIGIDASKKLHVIIIQADTIAEMLIADIQCCKGKKQDSHLEVDLRTCCLPNIAWLARILDVRRKFSWQNSFSGQPRRRESFP